MYLNNNNSTAYYILKFNDSIRQYIFNRIFTGGKYLTNKQRVLISRLNFEAN